MATTGSTASGTHEGEKVKRIIVLSDGTGNSAARVWRTNVWRMYQAIDLTNGRQVGLYDDGVGTSSFAPLAVIGGAFGWGLKRNVLDLYRFVCANYEEGAEIYGFGFSRGAFTIRVLMGLIAREGLVPATSDRQLRRDAAAAYRQYRHRFSTTGSAHTVKFFRRVRDRLIDFWKRLRKEPTYAETEKRPVPSIRFLGLWDTVAAYGLPVEEMTRGVNMWLWPLSLPDRELNPKVRRACHALALDDERTTFHPVLWTEKGERAALKNIQEERISQVWFTGMHSNVGGGYPDDGLAHVSLRWMMDQAKACDLELKKDEETIEEVALAADQDGRLYDSRRGLGGYYRYGPRKLADLVTGAMGEPGDEIAIERPKIHESVLQRIKHGARGYAPIGLPANYRVVKQNGDVVDAEQYVFETGGAYHPLETAAEASEREQAQERVWDLVWGRRFVYFATVAASLYLASFPWLHGTAAGDPSRFGFLSPVIRALGNVLPGFADGWIEAFAASPGRFLLGAFLVAVFMSWSGRIGAALGDRMRLLWTRSAARAPTRPSRIYRLRTHRVYRGFFHWLKWYVAPTVFAGLLAFGAIVLLSRSVFLVGSSFGLVCTSAGRAEVASGPVERKGFLTSSLCWPTGVAVKAGHRYRVTIDQGLDWLDEDIPAPVDRAGFGAGKMTLPMYAGVPFRRSIGSAWFAPLVRVGDRGDEVHTLKASGGGAKSAGAIGRAHTLTDEFVAGSDGELFLFVNDAVVGVPWLVDIFYGNNRGTADVRIEPLGRADRHND
jgi:uncharacterized protein (DUF2235 family)